MKKSKDPLFLKQTLRLAKKGIGWVNPNPMVGAVLVKNERIIGKGYHKGFGLPHAEIEAIKSCKVAPSGATLYVNLEPCSHFGRTPPCVEAIIRAKVTRVVCSTLDPNPKVTGEGVSQLRKAGIEVDIGGLEKEAKRCNEAFFTFHEKNRPFVAIKFAASLDGKIATRMHDSKWITNGKARDFARKLRGQFQAVLVGIKTVLQDNPHLGIRIKGKKDPTMIILDSKLKIAINSQVLRDKNVIIAATKNADREKLKLLAKAGFEVIVFKDNRIEIPKLLGVLKQKEIISILVDGGGEVLGSFIDAKLVDKVYAFHAPIIIGGDEAISAIRGKGVKMIRDAVKLKNLSFKKFEDNLLTTGYVRTPLRTP